MIFLIIFGVGLALAVLVFLVGELFELGGFGDAGDSLGADTPSPFSSRIIFVFMTAFGGVGFIAQSADWALPAAILAGLIGGAAVAGGTFFLVVLPMSRQQGSVKLTMNDLIDLEGEVIDGIPEGGFGRVSFVPPGTGARVARSARSENGSAIPTGTAVRVTHVGAGSVTVVPTMSSPFAAAHQRQR
jgi:hypothetical protein